MKNVRDSLRSGFQIVWPERLQGKYYKILSLGRNRRTKLSNYFIPL